MLPALLPLLRCPDVCRAALALDAFVVEGDDVRFGRLECPSCGQGYPILEGVAVLVPNPSAYMSTHGAGVRATVDWTALDRAQRLSLLGPAEPTARVPAPGLERAKVEYIVRHHLRADPDGVRWWEGASPSFLGALMLDGWNRDPLTLAARAVAKAAPHGALLDMGTNVGGLVCAAAPHVDQVLGMDLSLVTTQWGRDYLRGGVALEVELPGDRLGAKPGPRVTIPAPPRPRGVAELIVADVRSPPVDDAAWDVVSSLAVIDLLDEPQVLPPVQRRLLRPGGRVISASPYAFSEQSGARLRSWGDDSAAAVERLYRASGFELVERHDDVPWLFFRYPRLVDVYASNVSVYSLGQRSP